MHGNKAEYQIDRGSKTQFNVVHYAGTVKYDCTNFLDKNRDQLTDDAYTLLSTSNDVLLRQLFSDTNNNKRSTLASKFTIQLNDLMTTLNNTNTHYIRCIKPNTMKSATIFTGSMVNEQLSYSGVFEAITIRKSGYPFRYTHHEFFQRYKCMVPKSYQWSNSVVDNCRVLIKHVKQENEFQVGRTRILYRAAQHRVIELQRNLAVESVTTIIQSYIRRKISVNIYNQCKSMEPQLQQLYQQNTEQSIDDALQLASTLPYKPRIVVQLERNKYVIIETKRLNSVMQTLLEYNVNEYYDQYCAVIQSADDIQLHTPQSNQCRAILNEAKSERTDIDQQCEYELKRLDEREMKSILDHAEQIHYTTSSIQKLHDLLYNTTSDEFTKLQMKAAIALQDKTRENLCTIKLKQMTFSKIGTLFVFSSYPKLQSPQQWAEQKFLSLNKSELAGTMLIHSKQAIHSPLTQLPQSNAKQKEIYKLAKNMFKYILGYMGDRPYKLPSALAAELLSNGYQYIELRTELFCQIIKQLTQNSDTTSLNKGYELLLFMLYTFPPPPDFENFLEQWIRSHTQGKQYLNTLHQTLYGPQKSNAPSESQFDSILRELSTYTTMEYCPAATLQPIQQIVQEQVQQQQSPVSTQSIRVNDISSTTNGMNGNNTIQSQSTAPQISSKPRPAPPPAPAAYLPKPAVPEPSYELYVINKQGVQLGPITCKEAKDKFSAGEIDDQCICWHAELSEWTKICDVNDVLNYITS